LRSGEVSLFGAYVLSLLGALPTVGSLSDFVEGYLSFSLPAIATGLVAPLVGLPIAADVYGSVVIVLAILSLVATWRAER
jgi:hypothetical protein